jgi:hypothetical protein
VKGIIGWPLMIRASTEEAHELGCMKNMSDTKRISEAVANVATTIIEIIDLKLREQAEAAKAGEPVSGGINRLTSVEGWASKQETAKHLKISQRTL